MNNIIELGQRLSEMREKIEVSQKYLDDLKAEKEAIQAELIAALKADGLKSVKTDTHNYALVSKNNPVIVNETELYLDLEKRDMLKELMSPAKLDKTKFNSFALSLLKNTGEICGGIELQATEYISITAVK